MPRKTMDLKFPSLGVVRRYGHRPDLTQSEFGTPWCTNVRLEDILTGRLRGGSFTGIAAGTKASPVYGDRAITFSSNAILASRKGVHTDLSLIADISDISRPIPFQLSESGEVGDTVVAVIPHKDVYLLCFTATTTWVMTGDPATGSLRNISREVGIIGASAWCVNHDTVYFLSSHGLYTIAANGSGLVALSEDKIPEDLLDVVDTGCTLDYNHADRGVYVHLTGLETVSWLYDTERKGFWAFTTTTTASHVLLGPFHLGRLDAKGRVLNLHGTIAAGSDDVTWRIVTGDTAEDAADKGRAAIEESLVGQDISAYVASEGTWTSGRNHMAYPRTPAMWCCLWLYSVGTWAYEEVLLTATLSGEWR